MKTYPTPNEHGVYDENDENKVCSLYVGKYSYIKVWAMELPSGSWGVGYSCRFGDGGCAGPLTDSQRNKPTKAEAVDNFFERIIKELNGLLNGDIAESKKSECRDLLSQIEQNQNQGSLF